MTCFLHIIFLVSFTKKVLLYYICVGYIAALVSSPIPQYNFPLLTFHIPFRRRSGAIFSTFVVIKSQPRFVELQGTLHYA